MHDDKEQSSTAVTPSRRDNIRPYRLFDALHAADVLTGRAVYPAVATNVRTIAPYGLSSAVRDSRHSIEDLIDLKMGLTPALKDINSPGPCPTCPALEKVCPHPVCGTAIEHRR